MKQSQKLNVLLIEDHQPDARLIHEMLQDKNSMGPEGVQYEIIWAQSLSEGLDKMIESECAVCLLDLSLPDSTGLKTFRQAKAKGQQLPIIVLSGLDDQSVAIQAVSEGAQDYLVKGQVDSNLLKRAMHYAIERKHSEEEKDQIQEQLHQSQKMEAIGTLAGGIAHDFNNLMTAIQGFTDVIMMKTEESNPNYRALKQIRFAASSAADLTRQMLLFSRRHPTNFQVLNLNKVIGDLLVMVHRIIGEDIEIQTSLDSELTSIRADKGTMEQVILNLTVNARDAMPEGGKIDINTDNIKINAEACKGKPEFRAGNFIRLRFSDTGVGIPEDLLEHIFEPFFSSKGLGKGTGLGLSVVYGIIKQHEGWMDIQTQIGKGTTFDIYIPAVDQKVSEEDEQISIDSLQGEGKRLLIVEDSEGVREFASLALRENGYQVTAAATVSEAIQMYDHEKGQFDLIITDVVLPDRTGLDLIRYVIEKKEDQKVLVSSGYTDHKSQWPVIVEKGYPFLQKPYAYVDLLKAVKKAV
ncbi:response regulator [candidate division KSB1 bacterium]|nr:response regulator [candidate division KSB1 bacterium]